VSDDETRTSVGERLAAARSALGLTEEDVADVLNLSAQVIADLESQAWDSLPAPAFTRGYIRAYAKLLELDDDEQLIQSYERVVGAANTVELELPVASAAPRAGVGELLQRQPATVLSGAAVAGVTLLTAIVWAVWPAGEPERGRIDAGRTAEIVQAESVQNTASAEPADTAAETEAAQEADLVRAVVMPDAEPPEPTHEVPAPVQPEQPEQPVAGVAEAPVPVAAIESVSGSTQVRRLTPTGDDRLRLEFSADCWVEVKNEANVNLYGDLGRAGESLELVGAPPFRLLLGYAPGVVLAYNGESVPLAGYSRNNVAALWLGRRQ
jgi:cytoskeleton protein RodZ